MLSDKTYLILLIIFLCIFIVLFYINKKPVEIKDKKIKEKYLDDNYFILNTTKEQLKKTKNIFNIPFDNNLIKLSNNLTHTIENTYNNNPKCYIIIIENKQILLLCFYLLTFMIENGNIPIILTNNYNSSTQNYINKNINTLKNQVSLFINNKIIGIDNIKPTDKLKFYYLNPRYNIEFLKLLPNMKNINKSENYIIIENINNLPIPNNINTLNNIYYIIDNKSKLKTSQIAYSKLLFLLSNVPDNIDKKSIVTTLMDKNLRGEINI